MTPEVAQRARVVEVARSYIGTPYHHHGRLRGVGVDCATILSLVYPEAGVIPLIPLPHYPQQWFLHHSEEKYLAEVMKYCREIDGPPLPGDIAVWRIGRCFAHGAIVTEWPMVVHAYQASGIVLEADGLKGALRLHRSGPRKGQPREVRFFSPWGRDRDGLDFSQQQAG